MASVTPKLDVPPHSVEDAPVGHAPASPRRRAGVGAQQAKLASPVDALDRSSTPSVQSVAESRTAPVLLPESPRVTSAESSTANPQTSRFDLLSWCTQCAGRVGAAIKAVGSSILGAWVGVWSWFKQPESNSSAPNVGSDVVPPAPEPTSKPAAQTHETPAALAALEVNQAPATYSTSAIRTTHPALWDLFGWTEQTQDENLFGEWLRQNGAGESHAAHALDAMADVASEIIAVREQPQPVVLRDHNVMLLHPFAHDENAIFTAYLDQMGENGTYGSGPEARALAEVLGVRVAVYRPAEYGNSRQPVLGVTYGAADAAHTLHIYHDGGAHWQGLLRPQGRALDAPLDEGDKCLSTPGDGNCLFHAVSRALEATKHPSAKEHSHRDLRQAAVRHMRDNAASHMPLVRLEVNTARSNMGERAQDAVDTRAIESVQQQHAHLPWDATWAFVVEHLDDVQSFNGSGASGASRAMDRFFISLLRRMDQARGAGSLSAASFIARLTEIATSQTKSVDQILQALSFNQRTALAALLVQERQATLEQAEAASGPLFEALALRERMLVTSPAQINRLVVRNLQDPARQSDFIDTLAQELDATRRNGAAQHPLTADQWRAMASDPAVQQAARAALVTMSDQAPAWQPGKLRALYQLIDAAPNMQRNAWLQNLLRTEPQTFMRLGIALNRPVRAAAESDANRAAVDVMLRCVGAWA